MAMYTMNREVKALIESGYTFEQLVQKADGELRYSGGDYEATNRYGEQRITRLYDRLTAEPEASEPVATERQVDYITSLIIGKIRSGEGDGFASWTQYLTNGQVDQDKLGRITRRRASELISSLKGAY